MSKLYVQQWDDAAWAKNLKDRLGRAKQYRKQVCEDQWLTNEEVFYNASLSEANGKTFSPEDLEGTSDDDTVGLRDAAINYVFRDVRYMHAQMSANPPSIKIIPNTTDIRDEEASDAADITARWAAEKYELQELHDERNLKALTKGTGYIRWLWDNTLGRILDFDESSGCLTMDGDVSIYSPSTWNIWVDPDATKPDTKHPKGVKWFFELLSMVPEEAAMRWPEHKEALEKAAGESTSNRWKFWQSKETQNQQQQGGPKVDVYVYLERGEAINGMKGRWACMLESGLILEKDVNPNPQATLGLDILTDIDVEDRVYGKSIIEYLEAIQSVIQTLDANTLRNIAAHGNIRMYVDQNTELSDEAMSDDTLDIIQGKGTAPHFIAPPSQMQDAWRFRDQLKAGSQEVSMVNESMLGQMSRETSGFTFQTAINAGNMARRRLFNKYAKSVKNTYSGLLGLFIENWDEARTVKALGEERAYEVDSFKGADMDGGWDMLAMYGQNFSLDPNTARDQIMQLMPLFEKMEGFDYHWLVDAVRLNVMDNFVDHMDLGRKKQRRIFKKMIKTWKEMGTMAYVAPELRENHPSMLAYCAEYVMTAEYERLDQSLRGLIDQHIGAREDMAAEILAKKSPPAAAPAGMPAPMGLPQPPMA